MGKCQIGSTGHWRGRVGSRTSLSCERENWLVPFGPRQHLYKHDTSICHVAQGSRSGKRAVVPDTNRNRDGSDGDENHFEPTFTPFPQVPIEDIACEGQVPPQQGSDLVTTVK